MKKKTQNQTNPTITKSSLATSDPKKPMGEHFGELRSRLYKCALSIVVFGTVGYFIQQQLVSVLLKPSNGQQFIYTSPIGGLNFLFQVCIYFGIALSIPVIIYQLLCFTEPVIFRGTKRLIGLYSFYSVLLAGLGGCFGYFLGLPITLGFLGRQFTTTQIKPLLTIQEYMSFVTLYLLGAALLFQLPLIIMLINRFRPLSPRGLMGFQRYMILFAFVAAAIMTPTTDIVDQLIFAIPLLLMYQLAILLVWLKNRRLPKTEVSSAAVPPLDRQVGQTVIGPQTSVPQAFNSIRSAKPALVTPKSPLSQTSTGQSRPKLYWDIVRPVVKLSEL